MGEPILDPSGGKADHVVLRILYLPTFDAPVAIRYEIQGSSATRRWVELSGKGGYDPGKISRESTSSIRASEARQVMDELSGTGFWQMPLHDDVLGNDGSMLVIETVTHDKYQLFTRWTPESGSEKRGLSKLVNFIYHQFEQVGLWNPPKREKGR